MTHLGLDLSLTAAGWAIIYDDGMHQTGTFGDDTKDHISLRLRRWTGHLNAIIPYTRNGLHIVVEDLPHSTVTDADGVRLYPQGVVLMPDARVGVRWSYEVPDGRAVEILRTTPIAGTTEGTHHP